MYTLVDFITYVKNVEYLMALAAIGAFLIFWEFLKPHPFRTVVNARKDDRAYLQQIGGSMGTWKRIAAAPFIGIAYIISLPIGFFLALAAAIVNLFGRAIGSSFEWRPMEAYFSGKKKEKDGTKK